MRCENCGFENKDSAKFCEKCGSSLSKPFINSNNSNNTGAYRNSNTYNSNNYDNYSYKNQNAKPNISSNKKIIIIASVVLLGLVILLGYYTHVSQKNSQVQELLSSLEAEKIDKNYKKMVEINQELYSLTKDEKYKNEIARINKLKNEEDSISKVKDLIKEGSFIEAEKTLMNLENNKNINADELELLRISFKEALKSRIDSNSSVYDFDSSINLLEDLLNVNPDSELFNDLLYSINSAKTNHMQAIEEAEKQKAEEEERQKRAEQEEKERQAAKNKSYNQSTGLNGNYLYVTALKANVRSGPGQSYPLLYSLGKGTEVYVYDSTVNDKGIIWINIGDGWSSYKNFNGDLYY